MQRMKYHSNQMSHCFLKNGEYFEHLLEFEIQLSTILAIVSYLFSLIDIPI